MLTWKELKDFRVSVKASFTEASGASGVSRTRLWYFERGAARLNDAEREALEKFYIVRAQENCVQLKQAFDGARRGEEKI